MGLLLWQRREQLSAHAGIQFLLAVLGASGIGTIYVLDRADIFEAIQIGASVPASSTYVVLVTVIAILMLAFYLRFGRK